jgi:hypothetical protein
LLLVALTAYGLLWQRERMSDAFVAFAILVCLFNLSDASGSYALIFLLAYLPGALKELSRKELCALFLLFQPVDAMMLELGLFPNAISYLSGELVTSPLGFTYGSFFRPTAMLLLLLSLALRLTTGRVVTTSSAHGAAQPAAAAG